MSVRPTLLRTLFARRRFTVLTAVSLIASGLVLPAQVGLAQAATTPALDLRVSFQPDGSATPAGFTKDIGAAFSEEAGSGWIRQDSLDGAHVPYAVPLNTRDRKCSLPAEKSTFIHMQAPTTSTTNDATPVAWEQVVPNGTYEVTLGIGDASKGGDAESHTLNVEGVNAIQAFPLSTLGSCNAARLTTATVTVPVVDGRLTVDALGGTNTKLQFVTVRNAPNPVAELAATPAADAIALDWADADAGDAESFQVFRGTHLPVATTGSPLASVTASGYTDGSAVEGQVYYYGVQAVGSNGARSAAVTTGALIDDAEPAAATFPVSVNFGSAGATAVPDYALDFGQNFANVRGYGWVTEAAPAAPLDLVSNGRERKNATTPDKRLDTFMHMQANTVVGSFNGIKEAGAWELAVPDGSYDVTLAVGDPLPGSDPTTHVIAVEGEPAIAGFAVTPTTAGDARFSTATVTGVPVSDGRLTVSAAGGTNTKLDYVVVSQTAAVADTEAPAAPADLTATAGDGTVDLGWTAGTEDDLAGYAVYRSTDETVDVSGAPLSGETLLTGPAYTDATAVNGTAYSYALVAVDEAGNRSEASETVTATPAAPADPVDTEAPAAPADVVATAGDGRVDLAWTASTEDDLAGYHLYRSASATVTTDPADRLGGLLTDPAYADLDVLNGWPYRYLVTAVDTAGNESVASETVTAKPVDSTPPAAPGSVTATAGDASVTVTWAATADAATYTLYRGISSPVVPGPDTLVATTAELSLVDGDRDNGTELFYLVTATDMAGNEGPVSTEVSATPTATPAPACAPRSTLPCAQVPVTLPFALSFDGSQGGLLDATGQGTGFTMVDPPSARLTADSPVSNPAVPGYEPSKLTVTANGLQINATKGIAYRNPAGSARTNSQLNALGVGVPAAGQVLDVATTVRGIDFPATGSSEQGGLWFGLDEDNFVKLAVVNGGAGTAKVQLVREENAIASPGPTYELNSATFPESQDVRLVLHLDAVTARVSATYQIDGGPVTALTDALNTVSSTDQPLAAGLTDGTTLPGTTSPLSFAGVYGSTRNGASGIIQPVFTDFSVVPVAPAPADTTAPVAPTGVVATAGDDRVDLTWADNTEDDLAGYRVFRSSPDEERAELTETVVALARLIDRTAVNGTTYTYDVVAVDTADNVSAPSTPAVATPQEVPATQPQLPLNIAFSEVGGAERTGYTNDSGADYTASRGYGWISPADGTPLSLVGNGRTREVRTGVTVSLLQRGLMHLQGADVANFGGVTAEGAWQLGVPAGRYTVTVSVGDQPGAGRTGCPAPCYDSQHSVRVEGTTVIDRFQAVAGDEFRTVTATALVTDGLLTIDAQGGTNTKINYLDIAAAETDAPAAPADVIATAGDASVSLAWTPGAEADLAGYRVFRSATAGGPSAELTTELLTTPTFLDTAVTNGTPYFYLVTAVDTAGNASVVSQEVSATPLDRVGPAAPTALTATPGLNSVTLRWAADPVDDVFRYRIFGSNTSPVDLVEDNVRGTVRGDGGQAFLDAGLAPGVARFYVLVAEDRLGNASPASAEVTATPTAAADTTAPDAPLGVTATADGQTVTVSWSAVAAGDLLGYNVYRTAGVGGERIKLTATPVTELSFVNVDAPIGGTYTYEVTAVDTSNNESTASAGATVTIAGTTISVKINFQPAGPTPLGFTADTGAAFVSGGSGWVRQDSLSAATPTPLDLTANTRLRGRGAIDLKLDTIMHMQYGDIVPAGTTGNRTAGAWEYTVPNGQYRVTVSAGDQGGSAGYDSTQTLRVEGARAIDGFKGTAAKEYETATVTVNVNDGRLTIDAIGGQNTKINYATIEQLAPAGPDTTPPGAPTALTALGNDGAAALSWSPPADTDLAGYRIYRSTTPDVAPGATPVNDGPVSATSFTDDTVANGTRYYYVVTAVDQTGNEGAPSAVADVVPAPRVQLDTRINFADAVTAPPTGYLTDYGQAYGARTGTSQGSGLSYGWINATSDSPLSLVGNGRNRNVGATPAGQADLRLATFLHAQAPVGSAPGTIAVPGRWELNVPNGAYNVTVAVGDAGTALDSEHWINIEDQNAIALVVPTANAKFATATRTVLVTDGRLTLSPAGGTNTKIAYVDVSSFDASGRPYVLSVNPANGEIGAVQNVSPTGDLVLDADSGAVDGDSAVSNVTLTKVANGVKVAGVGGTSGGADTLSFRPAASLEAGTLYRYDVTAGARDVSGRSFLPYSTVFTTVAGGVQPPATTTAAFDKTPSGASDGKSYTSLVIGPDGRMYAGSIYGQIYRWDIDPVTGALTGETVINTVRTHATAEGWEGAPNRTIIGLAFDPASTATNPVLWITDNYAYLGRDVPDGTGAIARLSGPDLSVYTEVVVNLPRSLKDHETNSLAFNQGKIYVSQGSMNAMGALDGTWKREEHLLSAALLELDPAKLPATLPLDAATPDLTRPASQGGGAGSYSPYAPGAPLTLYATGIRNAYDLLWHSNGHLYMGTNGSAAGGATPATPASYPASCANRADGGYSGPAAPAIARNNQSETDYLFDVRKGKYYGHPNPLRCEYILNAGNPTGYTGNPLFLVNQYPSGQQADPNYDLGNVYDAGLHASANGTIEYQNTRAFGGAFAGKLVVVRYSANQELVAFDVNNGTSVSAAITGIAGFTGHRQPLDVVEDPASGTLYVSQLTNNPATTGIVMLTPQGGTGPAVGSAQVTPRLVFTDVAGGAASAAQNVEIRNAGNGPLSVSGLTVSGPDAARFALTSPTLPATVAPGATLTVPVTFAPGVPGPRGAQLTVTTDDPRTPTSTVVLRGLGTRGLGGSNEPSLQWILDTLQVPVNVGDPDPTDNALPGVSTAIGDEVLAQSFTKASFDIPVTVEPLALFGPAGPAGNPNAAVVNVHTSGKPAEQTLLFKGPNRSNQQVLPAADELGDYDLETPFGFDVTFPGLANRVAYSEDALNTWDAAAPHKIRVYPYKNVDGTVEPNAYVIAPEDVASPGVDYQDAVFLVRNVKPFSAAPSTLAASVRELVFSGVKGTTSPTRQVTVTNQGTVALAVLGATVAGTDPSSFSLTGGPQIVEAGASATYGMRFTPSGSTVGVQRAVLRLTTDSTATPNLEVGLYGLATNGEQGNNEPPLQAVVDTLGYGIDVGGSGLILGTSASAIGDEVLAPLFTKAGTADVGITPVARYSPDELLPFGWYSPNGGSPVTNRVGVIDRDNEQTLNPAIVAGGGSSFDPGPSSFGIYVESLSFGRDSFTQDGLNTGPTRHAARVYPAKDRAGVAIPDTYLVAFEDAANGDYQDYVFVVTGVRPAGATVGGPGTRINFQIPGSTTPDGYTGDTGAAYSTANGRGWVRAGTSTPLDMTAQARDRSTASSDTRLRTLILMQPTASQSAAGDGSFELAVPTGSYQVTVGVGDPSFVDSVHTVRVEGQNAVTGFVPTTTNPYSTGTATVVVTDGRLTVDAVGGTNSKLQYVDVVPQQVEADSTPPTVTAAVTGRQSAPGSYLGSALLTLTATDSGSGVAGTSYSLDNGPFRTYTAPFGVDTVGAHTVVARALDVAGNVTTAPAVSFTVVADAPSTGRFTAENGDGVPFANRLVMSRIQTPETGATVPANVVHDVSVLRVRNTGTGGLNVTGLTFAGPFALDRSVALPAFVPANGTLDLPVRFTATTIGARGGLYEGSVTVTSDDAGTPTTDVQLAGFWQSRSEGGQEPTLGELTQLFGYGTTIVGPGQNLNRNGLVATSGDEILSPYWLRADAAQPVRVRQLAAYHSQGNTASARWFVKGSGSITTVFTHAGVEGQSVLPHRNGSTSLPAEGAFNPTTAFGFYSDGESSDPTRNPSATDQANGCAGPCGHHVRFWPARDQAGVLIPNTYLMAMDYSGINYDYNDNVYLVSNVRPETAPDPAKAAPLPGSPALQLSFDAPRPGTVLDAGGNGTGFVATQPNKLDVAVGSSSYDPTALTLGDGALAIASAGTATTGSNGGGDNTLVNGLQLAYDGTGRTSVTGRVLGPLSALDAGSEQQGVMLGSDQDNYVKLAAINTGGVPVLELYSEFGGVGATQGAKVALPGAVSTLDLALVTDPAAGTVRGAYRIDDGSWTFMAATVTPPAAGAGRIFALKAKAGILVTHKGGAPFTARYDAFAVTAGDVTGAAAPVRGALYRLNVGGPTYTDTNGSVWSPDTGRFTPATAPAEGATGTPDIAGTEDDTLFRTYRGNVGSVPQAQRVLSYALPTRGVGTVDVRLLFAERSAGNDGPGRRVFDIEVEGTTVRRGFDIWTAAGGTNTAAVLPLSGITVTDGRLDLTLRATADYPAISAIEVLCQSETCPVDTAAPGVPTALTATLVAVPAGAVDLDWADNTEPDLLGYDVFRSVAGATPTQLNAAPLTVSAYRDTTAPASSAVAYTVRAFDVNENVSGDSASVGVSTPAPPVQQPVRINAGGPAQTVGGTVWSACSSTSACSGWVSGGLAYVENDTITGIPAGLNNTIFQSEWTGGATAGQKAFGYAVPVQNGRYTVRLHFAELNKFAAGTRVFSVDAEGTRALTDLDLFVAAGGADRAIVRTLTRTVGDGVLNLDFLAGVENAKVSAIEILPLDSVAPDAVTGLVGGGTQAAATVSWAASAAGDLAGYNVYRSNGADGTFSKVNTALVTGLSYSDGTAPAGSGVFYRVTAVDTSGNESVRSAPVAAARLADTTPPGVVTGLTGNGTAAGNVLAWSASTAADLAGYAVLRADTPTGTYARLNSALLTGTSYTDTSAPEGSGRSYRILALDAAGNTSGPSATVTVTRPTPPPPAAQQPIRINAGGPAQTVGGTAWSGCSSSSACSGWVSGGLAYAENDTITGIPAGLNNTIFQSEWTGTAARGQEAFGFAVPVQNGRYSVRLHFAELNKFAAGTRVFSVDLEQARVLTDLDLFVAAGGADRAIARTFTTTVSDGAIDLDFLINVQYAKVSAIEILPLDSVAPDAVTGLVGGGTQAAATVSWSASAAGDLAGYNVYRSNSADGTFSKVNTALVTGLSYSDGTAPAGSGVFYRVTAVDTSGNESVRSAPVAAARLADPTPPADTTPPAVITGVTGNGTAAGNVLTWSASTAADLAGYAVLRADTSTGTYARLNSALLTGTSYTDTSAPEGSARSYRVVAVDQAGNTSGPSATVTVTRPTPPPPPGAQQPIRINAGGPTQTVGGTVWSGCTSTSACSGWVTGGRPYVENDTITGIPAGLNNTIFQSEWTGPAANGQRAFGFAVPVQNGSYVVRLHFAELNKFAAGTRVFSVDAEGTRALTDLDLFVAAGGADRAIVRSLTRTVGDGVLNLDFLAGVEFAKVSAIEILPAGTTAPQPAIRVNAGGPAVTTNGVAYVADRYATGGKSYNNPRVSAIAGTSDDVLYRTERSATSNLGGFSYAVPVVNGTYDVTLRFAEIYWGAPGGGPGGTGRRIFDVNLEGGPVELAAIDLNAITSPTTAVVRTERVTVTDGVLDMAFSARVNQPTLAAFEIVPAGTSDPAAQDVRLGVPGPGELAARTETTVLVRRQFRSPTP